MQKTMKTESVADFIARGGQIKKVTAKDVRKPRARQVLVEATEATDVDFSALPEALKIKYGIR